MLIMFLTSQYGAIIVLIGGGVSTLAVSHCCANTIVVTFELFQLYYCLELYELYS